MTLDEIEKRLRETPVTEPDPAWREQILTNCDSQTPLLSTKAVALTAAVCLSGLSLHLLLNTNSAEEVPLQATTMENSSDHSILPRSRERRHTEDSFWDSILLKETDVELPNLEIPISEEVTELLLQHQQVLDRFTRQIRIADLTLPDPLPNERFRLTSQALLLRTYARFERGDSQGAVEACLAPLPLIRLLSSRPDLETTITQVGLVGCTIFAAGKGMDFATSDDQLRILQEALLELRPLNSMVQVFDHWLAEEEGALLPQHANLYYRAWVDAWDANANGFELEAAPGFAQFEEPASDQNKRYRNVIPDTADVEYRMRHVTIALMLERYRRAYGEIPDSLEDLIPEFTAFVPNSPWTGQPYDYEKISKDNARMSSPDLHDDQQNELLLRPLDRE